LKLVLAGNYARAAGAASFLCEAAVIDPADEAQRSAGATPEDVAQLLAEAAAVTTHDVGGQVEVQLGHFCNNRCVFCASGQLSQEGRAAPVPEAEVLHALDAAAGRGLRRLTFLGGEPTIQDSFLPALEHAAHLGFSEITVFTNGARLADRCFVERVLAKTPVTWRISIQGANEAAHDAATCHPGAFARIVKGLELLCALGQPITANMCLTTGSLDSLADLPDLLLRHGVRQMCIDMVRPVSAGPRTQAWMRAILPHFTNVARHVAAMLAQLDAKKPDYDINLTHLPYCVLPQEAHRISHGGQHTVTFTADLDRRQGVMDKFTFQADGRTQLPECQGCSFQDFCTGVSHRYLELYGSQEIAAVGSANLQALDPQQNSFAVQMDDAVARLRDAPAPGPWRLDDVERDIRGRRVELRLRYRNGTVTRVWLLRAAPPVDAGLLELAVTDRYRLAMAIDQQVPPRELAGLALACLTALKTDPRVRWLSWQTAVGVEQAAKRHADARRWLADALRQLDMPAQTAWHLMRVRALRSASELDFADGSAAATIELRVTTSKTAPIASRICSSQGADATALGALSQHIGAVLRATRAPIDKR